MTILDPCPSCHGGRYVLIQHADGQLPDLITCGFCNGEGFLQCSQCLDTGELWSADSHGEYEFDGYCPCPTGRTLAHRHCVHQRVWAVTVPEQAVF